MKVFRCCLFLMGSRIPRIQVPRLGKTHDKSGLRCSYLQIAEESLFPWGLFLFTLMHLNFLVPAFCYLEGNGVFLYCLISLSRVLQGDITLGQPKPGPRQV